MYRHSKLVSITRSLKDLDIALTPTIFLSAPGSHPTNFTGFSLNSTYIYLTWDPPPPSQVNGIIREYRLNITEVATGQVFQFTTDADERELTVGDLHPFYIYHCSVVAYTVLPGPVTSLFNVQTEEDGK